MRLLLDTHAFLWAAQEPSKLSLAAREAIEDLENRLYVSSISAFEIMTKHRLGKLPGFDPVIASYDTIMKRLQATDLPVSTAHAAFAGRFDWAHRDPFDRILAAQATLEDLQLVTVDHAFVDLPWVNTLW
ncbi:MAG: type II toxin-antitoxin system VapC family toxin [Propionibacteriaceae bacterium]|nr:type II toxin-antitoxin system VapC family toxin [Propionibacteriaceae bacterium]